MFVYIFDVSTTTASGGHLGGEREQSHRVESPVELSEDSMRAIARDLTRHGRLPVVWVRGDKLPEGYCARHWAYE